MYLYRHIQKWIYNSWSAFSKPCSDYPNTLTSSTANISPIQRNPLLNSVVADLDIRRRNQISKSASRLTLSSMTAVGATVVIPTKDQKNYIFVLRFPLFQSKLVFWYFRKEVIPVSTHEHRNFWSRIFLTRTYLFVNHKLNAEKIMLRDCLPFGHDYCPEIGFFFASRSGNPNPDISLPSPKCCGFRAGLRARWLSREDYKISCHSRLGPPWRTITSAVISYSW